MSCIRIIKPIRSLCESVGFELSRIRSFGKFASGGFFWRWEKFNLFGDEFYATLRVQTISKDLSTKIEGKTFFFRFSYVAIVCFLEIR